MSTVSTSESFSPASFSAPHMLPQLLLPGPFMPTFMPLRSFSSL